MGGRDHLKALDVLQQRLPLDSLGRHDVMVLLVLTQEDVLHHGKHVLAGLLLGQAPLHRLQHLQEIVVDRRDPAAYVAHQYLGIDPALA